MFAAPENKPIRKILEASEIELESPRLNKFIKVTLKLQKASSSTGFIKKALHHNLTPTFPKNRGQFVNNKDQLDPEQKLMISHLTQHDLKLKEKTNR